MQRWISIALVAAVKLQEPADVAAVRNELQQLNKQLNSQLASEDEAKKELADATSEVDASQKNLKDEKTRYADLQKKLEDVKRTDGVEQMKTEVSDDEKEEKALAEENARLLQKLEDVRNQESSLEKEKARLEAEDKESSGKLAELLSR